VHVLGLVEQLLSSASTDCAHPFGLRADAGLLGSFSAMRTSMVLRRLAISLSRTVMTRSAASVPRLGVLGSACAADCSSDFS